MAHSVEYSLKKAKTMLRKGELEKAEKAFQAILMAFPGNSRARAGLQKIIETKSVEQTGFKTSEIDSADEDCVQNDYDNGNFDEAIQKANKILSRNPTQAKIWNVKGASHGRLGHFDEAINCFEKVKEFSTFHASANNNIGSVYSGRGEDKLALQYYQMALEEQPEFFDAQKNLGAAFHKLNENANAIDAFKKALLLRVDNLETLIALASVYNVTKKTGEALNTYKKIISINPEHKQSWNNMGNIYLEEKQFDHAIECYETALEIDPNYSDALNNLGNTTKELGYLDEAIFYYEQAIAAPKARVELYSNYGVALKDRGYYDKALCALDQGIDANQAPYPDACWNKALVYLAMGDYEKGWREYEWRWQATNFDSTYISTSRPLWDGKKERVLIWPEQGIGDQIMFSTMFEEFAKFCASPIFQMDRRLLPIFRRSFPQFNFIPSDKKLAENEYDSHIPIGSIARFVRNSKDDFVTANPSKLLADMNSTRKIREAFRIGDKCLVGISWRSTNKATGLMRSLSLTEFLEPFIGRDVELVNLQYGDCKAEIEDAYQKTGIAVKSVNEIDTFTNIDHLASLIQACDRVITIDNSTVHLAASMGKPTDLLLPYVFDWRWAGGDDMPKWYDCLTVHRAIYGVHLKDDIDRLIKNAFKISIVS